MYLNVGGENLTEPVFNAYLVNEALGDVLVDDDLYVIRFLEEYRPHAAYLLGYLESDAGQGLLSDKAERYSTDRQYDLALSSNALRQLPVPVPTAHLSNIMLDVHKTEHAIGNHVKQLRELRNRLWESPDDPMPLVDLERHSTRSRVLLNSIARVDDPDYQISSVYPYLLAYPYRLVEPLRDPAYKYRSLIRTAEGLLALLASLGLALVGVNGSCLEFGALASLNDELRVAWTGGASHGHWRGIAVACAKALRGRVESSLATQFSDVWFRGSGKRQSKFAKYTSDLVAMRNDEHHGRGPATAHEYMAAGEQFSAILRECLRTVEFFVFHPIRLVQDVDRDWRTGRALLDTLLFVGDHPALRYEQVPMETFDGTKGQLYVESQQEEWLPLYPLISVHECPSCRFRETYFVDLYDGSSGRVVLKSFERGHVHKDDLTAQQLRADLDYWLKTKLTPAS